uniref:Uncharacterized protein n=1 Tax=Physcomitrium patens TaxID=3218 RepID=A0A2K1IHV6_PHYPA|nr:hypothetical protein PHYPA_027554 [Physcomitrium patens]
MIFGLLIFIIDKSLPSRSSPILTESERLDPYRRSGSRRSWAASCPLHLFFFFFFFFFSLILFLLLSFSFFFPFFSSPPPFDFLFFYYSFCFSFLSLLSTFSSSIVLSKAIKRCT